MVNNSPRTARKATVVVSTASQRSGQATVGGRRAAGKAAVVVSKTRRSRTREPGKPMKAEPMNTMSVVPRETTSGPPGKQIAHQTGKRAGNPGIRVGGGKSSWGKSGWERDSHSTWETRARARGGCHTHDEGASAYNNGLDPTK